MKRSLSHLSLMLLALVSMPECLFASSPVRDLILENRLEEATAICRQFDVLKTNDNDNYVACAWVYYRTDRVDSAERLMDKLRKNFGLPEVQLLAAYGKIKKKQYEEARRIIDAVGREHRGTSVGIAASELNAEIYEQNGQLDTAAFIYKQIVGDDPTRARAHWGLGRYYLARGDNARAKKHLEETARLWPKHLGSRFNLGVLALNQDSLNDAARWLADAYKLDRADPGVLEQLGLLFEKKGKMKEAVRHWQRALELKPDSAIAKEKLSGNSLQLVDALMDAKQYAAALAQLESSGKVLSSDPKFLFRRGLIYRNLGKYDKASTDLLNYTLANPKDGNAQRELGICYLNLKLPDKAVVNFGNAINLEPGNGLNYAWMAFVTEAKGDLSQARENWKKAVELLKEPVELEKATRKLASVEKKLNKKKQE